MKLITVEAEYSMANLDSAIELFSAQAETVRQMPGCAHYALYREPNNGKIAIVQRWETMEQFDAYRASATFAELGASLKPMMSIPPVTTVSEIDSD